MNGLCNALSYGFKISFFPFNPLGMRLGILNILASLFRYSMYPHME